MIRRHYRAVVALPLTLIWLGSPALAQSQGTFVGVSTNPNAPPLSAASLNAAFGSKADTTNGVLTGPTLSGGSANGTVANSAIMTPQGATNATTLANLLNVGGIFPDWFKTPADGDDDAPSIQRAINALCGTNSQTMRFYARHYAINSAVTQTCVVNWKGEGWVEEVGAVYTGAGTWFDIGTAFISSLVPITVSGVGATGSIFEDIAFDEPGMTASPVPVVNGSGRITGWSPASFTPASYNYIVMVDGAPGVLFRHIMLNGVNAGVVSVGSGRTGFFDIRGQAFQYLINVQQSYDINRIVDVHEWPYWSSADPVVQYQQSNSIVVDSFRNDTPMWDRIFAFGVKAGIAFGNEPAGVTTGLAAGSIECDFVKYCLWDQADASSRQITGQIANLRSYSQAWTTVFGAAVAMIPGSAAIESDASSILQIGNMENFGSDYATINGTVVQPSNITIASLKIYEDQMSANSQIVRFVTTGNTGSMISVSLPPILVGTVSGFTDTNTSPNGSGVGTFQYNVPAVVH